MFCQDRHPAGADLVGGISIGCDAVTAHETGLDPALFHDRGGHVVADEGNIHTGSLKFPGCQTGTLQQRPGLIGEDAKLHALFRGQQNGTKSRTVTGRGDGAGIAVGKDTVPVMEQGEAVPGDGPAHGDILLQDLLRFQIQMIPEILRSQSGTGLGSIQHPLNGPGKIHRRGAGGGQHGSVFPKPKEDLHGGFRRDPAGESGQGESGKDADGGSTAHPEGTDGFRHFFQGRQAEITLRTGKGGLIQDDHAVQCVVKPYMINGLVTHKKLLSVDEKTLPQIETLEKDIAGKTMSETQRLLFCPLEGSCARMMAENMSRQPRISRPFRAS